MINVEIFKYGFTNNPACTICTHREETILYMYMTALLPIISGIRFGTLVRVNHFSICLWLIGYDTVLALHPL